MSLEPTPPSRAARTDAATTTGPDADQEPAGKLTTADLSRAVTEALLGTPGVVRVEPTLRNALPGAGGTDAGSAAQNTRRLFTIHNVVRLTIRGSFVDATADIATDNAHPARRTAELAKKRIGEAIRAAGKSPTTIAIHVLAIERSA